MQIKLFGFEVYNNVKEPDTPVTQVDDDGAYIIDNNATVGSFSTAVTFDTTVTNETQLITRYREMLQHGEIEYAVDDIINEMMAMEDDKDVVDINLDKLEYPENIKTKIRDEFHYVLDKLNFNHQAYDIAKSWYVDGRLNYQVLIDENKYRTDGISEVRYIDPRLIKKIKVVDNTKTTDQNVPLQKKVDVYYVYSPTGFDPKVSAGVRNSKQEIKLSEDSVVYVTSGILDQNNRVVLSHLHNAMVPLNMLRELEDAIIIYRLSRSSERRVFYIDVSNIPPAKQQQHLQNVAKQYKNKSVYNKATGEVKDDRRFSTLTEDYFMPRTSDGKATEVQTLPGGQGLNADEEMAYYLNRLRRSLKIPLSRFEQGSGFMLGRQTEISRDEMKFSKFVTRLRIRFSTLFLELLYRQLTLKNIMTPEEFNRIRNNIVFEFSSDSVFSEIKDQEVLASRFDLLDRAENYIGRFFSEERVRKEILKQTDEEMREIDKEMEEEEKKALEKEKKNGGPDGNGDGEDTGTKDINIKVSTGSDATEEEPKNPKQ